MKKIREDRLFGDLYEHPSFGKLTFSSSHGSSTPLFGSSILHHNLIRMEINIAEYNRHTGTEYIFERKPLVIAVMSPTQFADAITGVGSGQGTPITLEYIDGMGNIPKPEFINKRKQFEDEFSKTTDDIIRRIDDLNVKAQDKKLPKWVGHELDVIKSWLKSNHPFIAEQFEEQMDKTVTEAKGEIEAYATTMIRNLGIESLKNSVPELPEATITKIENGASKID